jgi:DNA polymerase delta subunit 2
MEYLTGDATGPPDQAKSGEITRLIIAGNSLSNSSPILSREEFAVATKKSHKKHYGYDASAYNPSPSERLDEFLSEILPTLPVTLIPGKTDPASVAIPQQGLHPALFPLSRPYVNPPTKSPDTLHGLDTVTNPWEGDIEGWRFLGTGGQTVDDLLKYVDDTDTVDILDAMLRWRCIAPTAPDTLCKTAFLFTLHGSVCFATNAVIGCYPFQDDDPLIVRDCPHIYFAGSQPKFAKKIIQGPADQEVLLLSIPKFKETGQIVVLDMETLGVELVEIGIVQPEP